jgi:hypothetical protein
MIYLIHENKDINEITLIYYIKPSENMFYKEISEKDLPIEKEGYHRKLFYDKVNDKVYAEYEKIEEEKSEVDLLNEKIKQMEIDNAQAIAELSMMIANK